MQLLYVTAKILVTPILKLFAPTAVYGKKRYKNKRPLIYIGNHLSMVDVVVSGVKHRSQLYNLGKEELMKKKFVGACLRGLGMIPVKRGEADMTAMRMIFKRLKEGKDIQIFPEGTRNKVDNRLCQIHGGAALFAIKSRTAIIPFAFNKKARFARKNYMVFGDPFELNTFYGQRIDAASLAVADETVRQKMIETKRMVDYLASLRGKEKRSLGRMLNDPKIPFQVIFDRVKDLLLPLEYSVAPEGFDSSAKEAEANAD